MGKIASSWALLKNCWSVMISNKKLLLFPIVNLFFTALVLLFFLSGLLFYPSGHEFTSAEHWDYLLEEFAQFESESESNTTTAADGTVTTTTNNEVFITSSPQFMAISAIVYLISMFVMTFLNTAFFNEIINALNGEKVSIRNGLKFALTRLKPIAMWSLFAGIVGIALRFLEERLSFVGRIIISIIGVVWSVAAVFAVPVIIRDKDATNPLKVLKTSGSLIKQRWGEGLMGYVGIRGIGMLITLPITFLLIGAAILLIMADLDPLIVGLSCFAFWLIAVICLSYIQSVFNSIFQCALYVYAAEGSMPGPFEDDVAESVWKVKKSKKKQ